VDLTSAFSLYAMVTGHFPFFDSASDANTEAFIINGQLKLLTLFSQPLCKLLTACLQKDWKKRPSIQALKQSQWVTGKTE